MRFYRSTGRDAIGKYTERLSQFTGEVLIISGDNDTYVPIEQADQQRRVFGYAQIQRVPGAGHWPWLEQPDRVAGNLTAFLRQQTAKPAL